jgi:DNA polymerase III sliding clamp (beta) subunit (PCNA family)
MIRASITALAAAAEGATAELACPGTNACVRVANGSRQVAITGRTIPGTYPNYRPAIVTPTDAPTITVDRDAVRSALRRLGAVMDGRSPAVVVEVVREDQLRLHNLNTAAGTAQVTIAAEITGTVRRLALNAAYLAQILAHRPAGPVEWRVGRSLTSTHAQGVDLIMPVTLP